METPIYDSTKKGFENIEKQIDTINETIDRKIDEVVRNGKTFTEKELNNLKKTMSQQISKLADSLKGEQESQMKKLKELNKKIKPIKEALEKLIQPPSIDTIITWAKAAVELYTAQYMEVIEKVADITKTTVLVTTEVPKLVSKVSQLPKVLDKLDSITQPIKDVKQKIPNLPK